MAYDPGAVQALLGIGRDLGEGGRTDEAIMYFKKAAMPDQLESIPHYNHFLAYRIKGMAEQSERETELFVELGGTMDTVQK